MKKILSLMTAGIMILFVLAACGNDEDNETNASDNEPAEESEQVEGDEANDNEEEGTEEDEEQEDLQPGDVESEIFSALVAGSETYSVQKNGVDILEDGSAHSRLVVNLEIDDEDIDFDYMKQTAEEDTEIIGELLGEVEAVETAELSWLFHYNGSFYTFQLERDGDKLIVTEEDVDEEQLNRHIETYVPASEAE